MKRMLVGLIVCLSLSLNVAAQKKRSDREYDNLVGPVQIVKVETAKAEEKSGKVEAKDRTLQQSSTYDAKGNLIERRDRDHQLLGLDRHVFSYDAGGNRGEKHYLTGMPATAISPSGRVLSTDGSIEVNWKFVYDNDGNRVNEKKSAFEPKALTYRILSYEGNAAAKTEAVRVDSRPVALNSPSPVYTDAAKRNQVEGVVIMRLLVDEDGLVKQVRMVKGLPDGLDEQAILAAYRLKFKPAMRNGPHGVGNPLANYLRSGVENRDSRQFHLSKPTRRDGACMAKSACGRKGFARR